MLSCSVDTHTIHYTHTQTMNERAEVKSTLNVRRMTDNNVIPLSPLRFFHSLPTTDRNTVLICYLKHLFKSLETLYCLEWISTLYESQNCCLLMNFVADLQFFITADPRYLKNSTFAVSIII